MNNWFHVKILLFGQFLISLWGLHGVTISVSVCVTHDLPGMSEPTKRTMWRQCQRNTSFIFVFLRKTREIRKHLKILAFVRVSVSPWPATLAGSLPTMQTMPLFVYIWKGTVEKSRRGSQQCRQCHCQCHRLCQRSARIGFRQNTLIGNQGVRADKFAQSQCFVFLLDFFATEKTGFQIWTWNH